MECISNSKRRRTHRDTNYLFHRELFGDGGGSRRPQIKRRKDEYERVSIWKLDADRELRCHILVGEKPTYPYHIISIRRPKIGLEYGRLIHDDVKAGTIVYWNPTVTKSGRQTDFSLTRVKPDTTEDVGLDMSDMLIVSAATAWDIRRDHCAQVLFWTSDTHSALQFRYGNERGSGCVISIEKPTTVVGACFLGLNNARGYPGNYYGDGAMITAMVASKVYFYEPFGWTEKRKAQIRELKHWYTSGETKQEDMVPIRGQSFFPRVSVLDLNIFVSKFLMQKFSSRFSERKPLLQKLRANYVKKRVGVRIDKHGKDFDTTLICVGAAERVTESYYFFLLSLDPLNRTIQPIIARSLFSDDESSMFSPASFDSQPGSWIFEEAFERIIGMAGADTCLDGHDCGRSCVGIPGNMVKSMCVYWNYQSTVKEIEMDECRVILEGWGRDS